MLCARCKKRTAMVFVTRMEDGKNVNEGYCIPCARELNIGPINDIFKKMGISDEDIDSMGDQMESMMSGMLGDGEDGDFELGGTAAESFFQKMFGGGKPLDEAEDEEDEAESSAPSDKKAAKADKKNKKRKYLNQYCTDLTARARKGEIDTIVGRDREIYRAVQILSRRTKNNPCLIGEPGVGKTAIVEGLAQRIAAGDVPAKLKNKEILLLDMTALVAGTQFRGQFESRIKGLISEVKAEGNIILFIDEVHNLVGTGDAEGTMSAANILKPALSRGEIQVIGATTFNEYRKYIEKDAALERRFQPVTVEEPSIDETVEMLKGVRGFYEAYHGVKINDALIRRAVQLSERYITDRFLPDKAIDLLDEACAARMLKNKTADTYGVLTEKIAELQKQEQAEMENDPVDYEKMASIHTELLKAQDQADALRADATEAPVTDEDLAGVIELWTGIPATKVQEDMLPKLSRLEDQLKEKIKGQDEAISLIAAAIRRTRVQISPRRRPASFIFVGPTGVGKTELVKVLAAQLFDTPETLIRLDMSEFMEKHAVSRIIGSPPGYVGYDEAGQLTEKVRRKPYSVLLFDEIEKAHPDVLNILLQILDEGRVTDAHGRVVNFENTVIVMTSNAGSNVGENLLGFGKTQEQGARDKAVKALSDFLRPEFLSRVDEVVYFRPLSVEEYADIADLMLSELVDPLKERDITLSWERAVCEALAKKTHGGKRGARDLRSAIRREVEDVIAAKLVELYDTPPKAFTLAVGEDDTITVSAK